ncbi:hypothetical protein V8G54_005089 [Vigna mungo]|uniref:Thioredoxin domain-containing protein n=1 Tax=Vigna mungo TaxID=3915 RepID=A0AAQ3PG14_VIGMU
MASFSLTSSPPFLPKPKDPSSHAFPHAPHFVLRMPRQPQHLQTPLLLPKIQSSRHQITDHAIAHQFVSSRRSGIIVARVLRCCLGKSATPVTKDLWDNSILKSETPVLVIFYANWCGPCRMVHRIIDEIAAEYAGKLKCFIVNTDTDMQIAEDYDIKAVPVVLMLKNGQKCDSVIGTMPKEFYVAAIERVLKS